MQIISVDTYCPRCGVRETIELWVTFRLTWADEDFIIVPELTSHRIKHHMCDDIAPEG